MILLVTPNLRAEECTAALHQATNEEVAVADSLRKAATLLHTESYLAVVLDQYLVETEPDEMETVMQHLGTAIPLQVNLAISGMERLAREVRAAVQRRKREQAAARQAAVRQLRTEINGTVAALLSSCGLALDTPGLPAPAFEQIKSARGLVQKLRSQLETDGAGKD